MAIKVVKVVYTDGTKAIVGHNHETELEATRMAETVSDSWDNVLSAEVIHHIPPVKIRETNGRLILK